MAVQRTLEDRMAALEEHLVGPTAEELLAKAEQRFAAEGNTAWAQLALATAKLHISLEGLEIRTAARRSALAATGLDSEDDDDV